ncbi:hypothetical protein, partial [Streptomyces mirabilis]|uniref:hypothetical protein n=1 Tax=Streptomyces mirabilis TaxID=68239 RepID=UPI001E357CCA
MTQEFVHGLSSPAIAVCGTNGMPWNTSRSECRVRRSTLDISGSNTADNSVSTSSRWKFSGGVGGGVGGELCGEDGGVVLV